jgi:hypothetical protein
MDIKHDEIMFAPSIRIFPWSSNSLTNYVIYAPQTRMEFFRELVEEGTKRIKETPNKNFIEYIPYTTGRALVSDLSTRHNIKMMPNKKIKDKFCSFTDTADSVCYHEGSTIRNTEDGSWRSSTVMNIVNTECNLREKNARYR